MRTFTPEEAIPRDLKDGRRLMRGTDDLIVRDWFQ